MKKICTISGVPRSALTSESAWTTPARSASVSEVTSPVVASATSPAAPASSDSFASRWSDVKSIEPSSANGVTSGTYTPRSCTAVIGEILARERAASASLR